MNERVRGIHASSSGGVGVGVGVGGVCDGVLNAVVRDDNGGEGEDREFDEGPDGDYEIIECRKSEFWGEY